MRLARLSVRLTISACLALIATSPAYGQTAVGVQKFGAYDGFPDTVDVATLGIHLEIPLYNKPGRGNGTGIVIALNNYTNWPKPWVVGPGGKAYNFTGPTITIGLPGSGYLTSLGVTSQCRSIPGSGTFTDVTWTYADAHGNSHLFPGNSQTVSDSNNTCSGSGITPYGITAQASDGSGYLLQAPLNPLSTTITSPSGRVVSPFSGGAGSVQDSNGNVLAVPSLTVDDSLGNISSYTIKDTVGTSITVSGGGYTSDFTNRSPLILTYLDDSGNPQTITITYKLYTLGTTYYAGLMDSITYPDGSAYHFTYLPTLPVTIASITLPSGGLISYTYPGGVQIFNVHFGCPYNIPSLTRTTSDGTTTYTRTITSATNQCGFDSSYTQVTKPNGDQTITYFVMPQQVAAYLNDNGKLALGPIPDGGKTFQTKQVEYDHSNLGAPLRTSMRCYNGATGDCTSTAVNEPVTQLAISTTLDNGLTSKTVTQYNAVGLPTELDEYDFGGTSPLRKTITSYATLGNNISDRPASVIVYDGTGNQVRKTTFAYDEVTPPPMTLPGHTTVSGSRGNPTSVYSWLNTTGANLLTKYAYDDAGQVTSVTNPNGNTTSHSYDATTDAYQTKITRPTTNSVAHISTFGYGPNSGLLASAYDENNQLTSYIYDSLLRPSSITYPGGAETTFSYTPTSRTTNSLLQTGVWSTNIEQFDGYGRISETEFVTDPDGADFTATTYDSLGRVARQYNPTRCNPPTTNCGESTWGYAAYTYDALNRTTQVTNPDNSTVLTTYTGRATQVQDEGNGTQRVTRISQVDALGRIVSVCEASGTALIGSGGTPSACGQDIGGTGFLTTYQYDVLDNLLQVSQPGIGPRTFVYDSLSRLTSANNPESGPTSYAYDANGNLLNKTSPAPNQTGSATVTLSYCQDALNRLTAKAYTFSPSTPPTCATGTLPSPVATYIYDIAIDGLSIAFPVGRLVKSSTSDGKTGMVNSYDQMGRVQNQWQCTPQNCGAGYFSLPYGHDLIGDITSSGNGMGVTLGYSYPSGRLTQITSSLSDSTHPTPLLSGVHYNAAGAIISASFGNGASESFGYDSRLRPTSTTTNGFAMGTGSSGSATLSGTEQNIPGASATPGTGSVTFSGNLQSKQVQTQTAAAGTGSVTVGGSEQNKPAIPPKPGSGSATVTGSEGTATICTAVNQRTGNCIRWSTVSDTGNLWVTINGYAVSVAYGSGSTSANLASALVTAINSTSGTDLLVTASLSGTTVNLTATTVGASTNYSLSSSSSSNYNSIPSFSVSVSGASLTGGSNAIPAIYDAGTVSVIVNGFTGSYHYGQNDTPSSIASGLAIALGSSTSVNTSASGNVITLTAKAAGSATNYSLSTSDSYDTSHFSSASFTTAPSGSTLTGGRDAAYTTVYDSGSSTITVNGHSNTIIWSGSSTASSSIASALATNINADSAASVTASASSSIVNLTAKTTGAATNYSLSSSSTYDSSNFSSASFSSSNSGSTLTSGHDAGATTYDSGSAWITVNGTQYSVSYGQSSTATSLASSLAQAINGNSGSPVTATASSAAVSLASKGTGSSTNYSLAVGSSTSQSSSFSQPSFTVAASGGAMSGGTNGAPATLYSLSLSYAPDANVTSANDSVNGNWAYGYDLFNRLACANLNNGTCASPISGQVSYTYDYDRFGNRWHQNGPHSMMLTFTGNSPSSPNNNNRIDGYSYDAAGNLLNDGIHGYTYDAENRVIAVDGGATASYVYDANGRRVRKTAGGSVDYLYDTSGHQIAEVNSSGGWNRGEIYAGDSHLSTYNNSTTYFTHRDWLGTERVRSNVSGAACETIFSLPFGDGQAISGSCGDPTPMHFTGKERDSESNLDNFGARFDSSSLGRFMSPDPGNAGASVDDPQSWNAYIYVIDDPLNRTDPDGRADDEVNRKKADETIYVNADGPAWEPRSSYSFKIIWENAGNAARRANDYLHAAYQALVNSRAACTAAWTATGALAGAVVGAEAGGAAGAGGGALVGLAGGPAAPITVPLGAGTGAGIGGAIGGVGGGLAGGATGFATGQAICSSGTGSGGGRRTSPNQMNEQAQKGQAPDTVERVDTPRFPHEQPHIEFKDGNALNIDGTWKHGGRALTNAEANWITSNGWSLPK